MKLNRLKIKLTVIVIIVSSLPVLFFAFGAYKKAVTLIRKQAISHLETIAVQNVLVVDKFRSDCVNDLKLIAASFTGLNGRRPASLIESMRAQRTIFKHVFVADVTGKIRHSSNTSDKTVEKNLTSQHWFKTVINGDLFSGDVNSCEIRGKRDLLVAVPIRSPERKVTGVLAVCVDFSSIAVMMKTAPIGRTGEIYLINREGVFLTTTWIGRSRPGEKVAAKNITEYFEKVASDEHIDYRGVKVMRAYKKLYDLDWILFVEQDSAEIFNDVRNLRSFFLIFAGFFFMLAATGGYLISVKIAKFLKKSYEREKELEMQLIQKDKLASMGLLTAGIAHELNTPLANALLGTQMLKEDTGQTWPKQAEALSSIEQEIKRGSTIVRNLLDFSRQSHTDSAVTDVNDVLNKLLDIAQKLCSDKNIHVKRTLASRIPFANGNASILHQVFMNIVSNAVEAMENGGTLHVLTKYMPVLNKIVVEIQDSGPGILEEHIPDVFDPFFTTKASEDGTGLGLAISYTMVKKMGGDIKVTSSCKEKQDSAHSSTGTTFSIELPVYDNDCRHNENRKGEEK